MVIEKRSNASKDSKIHELSHELEKLKSDIDQHVRLEKKNLKAEVIQTCIELFQEKYPYMDFQRMLIGYVSKEKARKKSPCMGQLKQMLQSDEVKIEGETSLTNKVIEDQEDAAWRT